MTVDGGGFRMLAGLLEASHLASMEALPALVTRHCAAAGFSGVTILVPDLRQENLIMLDPSMGRTEVSPVDAGMAGRCYRHVELIASDRGTAGHHFWLPLLDGTERVGVLGVVAPVHDKSTVERLRALASAVALILVSKKPHSDSYAELVRSRPMSVSADLVWPLIPPLAFATEDVVVTGKLEPAYEIGGDALDYAMTGDAVHLSIFDAMGHDRAAGLTVALAVGTCRNSRRRNKSLTETSVAIDEAIAEQFGRRRFATGILAHLDHRTGMFSWVNRGHPPPLLIRQGRWLKELSCRTSPPMGFRLPQEPVECGQHLEPGDRLLFYTDGIVEARAPSGTLFGLQRFADFVVRREADGLSAPETLRRLMHEILEYQHGELQDDATVLLVEWRSHRERRMVTSRRVNWRQAQR
ncbi:PP2C family protein-serine/threonine phosphatase [Kibdelosporangium persicum]|uniref:Serine phosphatase RsbU, regulator of sigma subunit n=1 Tax=Kibdelosporangium persicum TaxID=2698649 RepID=A0ABX2FCZ5_9PSEU|nr:PP2C family protein-serine/threonine phosphatase [Kibdelosporangium persicum]NRN68780.1 Serine phosphatase RsbU, regulator of sigma subunit [Kibdelosporangium persicum]